MRTDRKNIAYLIISSLKMATSKTTENEYDEKPYTK